MGLGLWLGLALVWSVLVTFFIHSLLVESYIDEHIAQRREPIGGCPQERCAPQLIPQLFLFMIFVAVFFEILLEAITIILIDQVKHGRGVVSHGEQCTDKRMVSSKPFCMHYMASLSRPRTCAIKTSAKLFTHQETKSSLKRVTRKTTILHKYSVTWAI